MNSKSPSSRVLLTTGLVTAVLALVVIVGLAIAGAPPLGLVVYSFLPVLVAVGCLISWAVVRPPKL